MRAVAAVVCGRRAKWVVVVLWLVIAGVSGQYAGKLSSVERNDSSAFLPGGAESTKVIDLAKKFPGGNTIPTVAIYARDSGLTEADRELVAGDARQVRTSFGGSVVGPIYSADGRAALLEVPVRAATDVPPIKVKVDALRAIVDRHHVVGLQTAVTGPAALLVDQFGAFQGIDSTLLIAAIIVVAVLLLVIYRSPVLWLVPLVAGGLSIAAAEAAVYGFAKAGLVVNGQSAGILTVLVFGAGTDYALLLISRYREELRRHDNAHEAMRSALAQAGPAVLASASTVILGLLTLLVAELNSDRGLGPVAAVGIACALIAMTTALPALLIVFGRRLFWPFVPHVGDADAQQAGVWSRIGGRIARRPRRVWVATGAVLVICSLGLVNARIGLPTIDAFVGRVESVSGQHLLRDHFPAGSASPTTVIATTKALSPVTAALRSVPGVVAVTSGGSYRNLSELQVTLAAPSDSAAAFDGVRTMRAKLHAIPGANALVGGSAATNLDVSEAGTHDRYVVMPLVLLVVVAVLAVLLRALLAPIVLLATVILSFAAALGLSTLVLQHAFGFAGFEQSIVLIVFIFLVALGIDYNIFLVGRIHEEARVMGTRRGTLRGLAVTGGVITSAGVVLAGTFAVLTVLPLVALVEAGFTVALGVLIDTFVVRSILVPALSLDLDRRMWWPSPLSRPGPPAVESAGPSPDSSLSPSATGT